MNGRSWQLQFGPFQLLLAAALVASSLYLLASPWYRFAFVPGLVVLALLPLARHPRLAFYLFVFLIPFEFFVRLSETREQISIPKFLGVWLTLSVLLELLLKRERAAALRSRLWLPVGAFVVVNLLATVLSPYALLAADHLRMLIVGVLVFALALFFLDRRGLRLTLPSVLIWGVMINYFLFVLEYVLDLRITPSGEPVFPKGGSQAAYALPTSYSVYFVLLLPFLLHRLLVARTLTRRAVWAALGAVAATAIIHLGSRAGALISVVTVVLLLLQHRGLVKPRLLGFLLGAGALAGAAVLLLTPPEYWTRQRGVVAYQTDSSISRRVSYLQVASQTFWRQPLIGSGPGTFQEHYATSPQAAAFAETAKDYRRYAHNTYLEVLIGSGLLGLLALAGVVWVAFANFRRAARSFLAQGRREEELVVRAYSVAFVAILVFFLFISNLYMKHFWILLAVSELAVRVSETPAPDDEAEQAARA